MRSYLLLFLFLIVLAGCIATPNEPAAGEGDVLRPSQVTASSQGGATSPTGDFFYSLPNYEVGETATLDGYTATVNEVNFNGDQLDIQLDILNDSGQAIDMVWAVQLIQEEVGYITPLSSPYQDMAVGDAVPADVSALEGVWSYDLLATDTTLAAPVDLDNYRLLFAPRGWSGPVFVFRLTSQAQ